MYTNSILGPDGDIDDAAMDRPLGMALTVDELFSLIHPNFMTLKYTFPTISDTGDLVSFKHRKKSSSQSQ